MCIRLLLASALCFVFLFSPPAIGASQLVDRVVAIVNNDIVTFSELNQEGGPIFKRITQQAPPDQVEPALLRARQQVLQNLIDRLIIEQRAAKLGITVSDQEVEEALTRILDKNHATMEKFRRDLALMGTTVAEYRRSLRDQILQSKLIDYEIRSRVVVPEEKIKEYYQRHYLDRKQSEAYHLLQMGFAWSAGDPTARAMAKRRAEEARKRVLAGEDFGKVAREMSDLPSANDGGDIGVFKKEELAGYMKQSIQGLKPGQISPVVETPAGYQFFKLLSDQGNARTQRPYAAVKQEIRDLLYKQALESQFKKWVKELRNNAYIKVLL